MTDHACLILDHPLFSGIEAEGPRKSARTLFVASPNVELPSIIKNLEGHDQVYLGGGRLSEVSFDLAREVLAHTSLDLSIEVSSLNALTQAFDLDNPRVLAVCTLLMRLPNGESVPSTLTLREVMSLRQTSTQCALKIDTGSEVVVIAQDSVHVNGFDAIYAEDRRLEL